MTAKEILKDQAKIAKLTKYALAYADGNGNGFMEKQELQEMMENIANEIGIEKPTFEELDKIYSSMDKNNDGRISFEEFKDLIKFILNFMVKTDQK